MAVGAGILWVAGVAAQVEKPAEQPAENPPLQNTGKPMIVDFVCGEEDIRLSGLSCTIDDPCPVFLELASVEAVGNRIFVAGNIHSSTTTLYSVLLSSGDAGKTWREPYERMRLAGLDRIQFIDFENGWVSGEVQHPLPRDPFLLVTTDGGKTWQAHTIFAEPQFGSILQFWFNSRTNGSLVIDRGRTGESGRYELYETPNAGETWMLRQTNEQPIQMKRRGRNGESGLAPPRGCRQQVVPHRAADRRRVAWRRGFFGVNRRLQTAGACRLPQRRRSRRAYSPSKIALTGVLKPGKASGSSRVRSCSSVSVVTVGVADLDSARLQKNRPDRLAAVLEVQLDFGLQTVGRFRRHNFNSQVRRTAKSLLDAQFEALAA